MYRGPNGTVVSPFKGGTKLTKVTDFIIGKVTLPIYRFPFLTVSPFRGSLFISLFCTACTHLVNKPFQEFIFMTHRKVYKGLETQGSEVNTMIEQALGHAMLDAAFQEELFSHPERVGREIGLSEEEIALLKTLDENDFTEFRKNLNANLGKLPIIPIFCAAY